jgi:hypothetical protein
MLYLGITKGELMKEKLMADKLRDSDKAVSIDHLSNDELDIVADILKDFK